MSALKKGRKLKDKANKTQNNYSEEEVARQKLIQFSQKQYSRKDSSDKFAFFLEAVNNRNSESPRKQEVRQRRSPIKLVSTLPKSYFSAQFNRQQKKQKQNTSERSQSNGKSELSKKIKQLQTSQVWIKRPVSLSNYLVTGIRSNDRHCQSAPKSDYIIRQRRNSKKLQRLKQKRELEDLKAKNSLFDKIVNERQTNKLLNMQRVLLGSRHKKISYLDSKEEG